MGLDYADVVYIEEAERGSSRIPVLARARPLVRAVLSVRTSDPGSLGAYGKIIWLPPGEWEMSRRRWIAQVWTARSTTGVGGFHRDLSLVAPGSCPGGGSAGLVRQSRRTIGGLPGRRVTWSFRGLRVRNGQDFGRRDGCGPCLGPEAVALCP
jgi:hypothetical protein